MKCPVLVSIQGQETFEQRKMLPTINDAATGSTFGNVESDAKIMGADYS